MLINSVIKAGTRRLYVVILRLIVKKTRLTYKAKNQIIMQMCAILYFCKVS